MAMYQRLGSFVLASELTSDPFGKVHRGLTLVGSRFERHKLLRVFSDELQEAGLGARFEESLNVMNQLSGSRCLIPGFQPAGGRPCHAAFEHTSGRSLAQMLQKARQEQIPLGVDHALTVLQGVSQAITFMHSRGVSHGALSPFSVWVNYEGAAQLLDAPYASQLAALLPKCPMLARSLAPYRPTVGTSPLQLDVFGLGAILFELLTFEPLPAKEQIPAALREATLKAAQDEAPIPEEIQGILRRMLLVENPFESADAFAAELDRVMYDGDYSPTTFNMAFFMHTLFREEAEVDTQALKADEAADFTPLVADSAAAELNVDTTKYVRYGLFAGIPIILLLGGLFYSNYSKNKQLEEQNARLVKIEEEFKKSNEELGAIKTQKANLAIEEQKLLQEKKNAKTDKEKKDLEAKQQELDRKKQETQRREQQLQQQQAQQQQAMQAARQATAAAPATSAPKPTPQTTAPAPQAAPAPQPSAPAQTTAAPAPQAQAAAPVALPVPAVASATAEIIPPSVVSRAAAAIPVQAIQKKKMKLATKDVYSVTVKVLVDERGTPIRQQVVQDSGVSWGFEDAAEKAALASTFKPGTTGGKPSKQWVTITYSFKL